MRDLKQGHKVEKYEYSYKKQFIKYVERVIKTVI